MCNCYAVCGDDFENTIGMVANARGRTPEEVKATLIRVAEENAGDKEYRDLRSRLPRGFPF